jgi:hypothetical protein
MTAQNADDPSVQAGAVLNHGQETPVLDTDSTPAARPEAAALREFADLLDANPDLRCTDHIASAHCVRSLDDADQLRARLGGMWRVERAGDITFVRRIGPVEIRILVAEPVLSRVA